MKPYDVGVICGRFQTFHIGHESLVNTALTLCDRVLILVGSSQECGTERNVLLPQILISYYNCNDFNRNLERNDLKMQITSSYSTTNYSTSE